MSTKITYNSKTTEVANGKIATLSCNGKKMTTDVVIEVPTAIDSPLPIEVSTEAEMTALLTSGEVGGVYKYTGTTGTYENGALYVLEEDAESIVGTWVFNDGSALDNLSNSTTPFNVSFTCNGQTYSYMKCDEDSGNEGMWSLYYGTDEAYGWGIGWYDQAYRTINITSEPTDETFITWLKANATKQ